MVQQESNLIGSKFDEFAVSPHYCNPSTLETETGGLLQVGGLQSKTLVSKIKQ